MSRHTLSNQDPLVIALAPCHEGRRLLEVFATVRPQEYGFMEPKDFSDVHGAAFAGISEGDQFAEHFVMWVLRPFVADLAVACLIRHRLGRTDWLALLIAVVMLTVPLPSAAHGSNPGPLYIWPNRECHAVT